MRRITKMLSVVPVLAFALSACDSADRLTSPNPEMQQASGVRVQPTQPTETPTMKKAPELASGGDNSAIGVNYIGAEGGIVKVWGAGSLVAQLVVPAGATDVPALFTVRVSAAGEVMLTATRFSNNDVGSKGFKKPVKLYVNPTRARATVGAGLRETATGGRFETRTLGDALQGDDPNSPPEGEGWVWFELEGFAGAWIHVGN